MSLKSLRKICNTTAFRLVFWYTAVFTISSILAFNIYYAMITSVVRDITDDELIEEIAKYDKFLLADGVDGVIEEMKGEAENEDITEECIRLLKPDGEVIYSTDMSEWGSAAPNMTTIKQINNGEEYVIESPTITGREDEVKMIYGMIGGKYIIQFGKSLDEESEFLNVFKNIFFIALLVMMLIVTLVGWFMSKWVLRGINEVTMVAVDIQNGSLNKRMPVKFKGLEVETLATTFNAMLDHIETLIKEMRELTDNIAHDLRNPIAGIRGRAELALTSDKTEAELKSIIANTVEDCDQLLHMVNTMLDLSEADSGAMKLKLEEIELSQLILDAVEIFEPLADIKDIRIVNRVDEGLIVSADRQGLQRIIANLLDNAIKYIPAAGEVTISTSDKDGSVEIAVEDNGIGINEEEVLKIFDRYYRVDKSRSNKGIGLGLSLARAIARAHQGDITVDCTLGKGCVFTISLPKIQA